jgi:CAAX amino terminal protease family.
MKKALIVLQGLLMTFAAYFAVSLIYSIIEVIFILLTGIEKIDPQVDYCLMVLAVMVSNIVLYVLYKKYLSNRTRKQVDLKEVFSGKNIGIYLGISIGCQMFVSGVLTLISPFFQALFAQYEATISSIFISDTIIAGVYVVILAPVVEELMIRGILLNRLRYALPFYAANLIQAAVFGIYHGNVIQGLYAFGIGLILGYIYEKTGTLWASVFVHMLINGSGFLAQALNIQISVPVVLQVIVGGILLFAGIFCFYKNTGKTGEE